MVVDAAGALQQSIGRPLVVSESAQWPYGATNQIRRHPLQRLFTNSTPDGVLSSGGFCYELPVVDGPFVYNGFVSWPFSFVCYWYLDLPLSQDYNNEVLHRFVMYCVTYARGDCVAPRSDLYMCMRTLQQ